MAENDKILQVIFDNLYEVHRMTYLLTYLNLSANSDENKRKDYGFYEVKVLLNDKLQRIVEQGNEIHSIDDLAKNIAQLKSELSVEIK